MKTLKKLIKLANVSSSSNNDGDTTFIVTDFIEVYADTNDIGILTKQYGVSINIDFTMAVTLDRMLFNDQRYMVVENNLFEIKDTAKAKYLKDVTLNVTKISNENIKTIINKYIVS